MLCLQVVEPSTWVRKSAAAPVLWSNPLPVRKSQMIKNFRTFLCFLICLSYKTHLCTNLTKIFILFYQISQFPNRNLHPETPLYFRFFSWSLSVLYTSPWAPSMQVLLGQKLLRTDVPSSIISYSWTHPLCFPYLFLSCSLSPGALNLSSFSHFYTLPIVWNK